MLVKHQRTHYTADITDTAKEDNKKNQQQQQTNNFENYITCASVCVCVRIFIHETAIHYRLRSFKRRHRR